MELTRRGATDIPAGRRPLVEVDVPEGLRTFLLTYSTVDWPVVAAGTVTFTLVLTRGTRGEQAVWSDTIAYVRATKRPAIQSLGATVDGGLPANSSLRIEIDGPALRTPLVLEGD